MNNLPDLEAILECIICHVVPRKGPIFQCPNGHLVCKECSEKALKTCAMCQVRLPQTKIRCISAEQVIEKIDFVFACDHAVNGCDFTAVRKTLEKHERICESRLVPCPDGGCHEDCQESIPLNKLLLHLKDSFVLKSNKHGVYWRSPTCPSKDIKLQTLAWNIGIFNYADTTFLTKISKEKGMFHAWLYIVAGADIAEKYQVKITIDSSTTSISHTGKVLSIDVKEADVVKRDDVLSFGENLFGKLTVVENETHKICIGYEILTV
jgi:hypothetical protein